MQLKTADANVYFNSCVIPGYIFIAGGILYPAYSTMKHVLLTVVPLLFILLSTMAQNEPPGKKEDDEISVDLPDETEETVLVKKGQWQFETSVLYNTYKKEKASLVGQGLIRYGLSHAVELRLLVEDGRQRDTYITSTVQSTYPLAASAKVLVLKDVKGLPDISLVSYLKLPFTSRTKEQQRYWSPLFLAAFQNKLSSKWKLEYNAGIQQEAYGTAWAWLANGSLHYKITDPLEVNIEYYAQYQVNELPQHNLGAGIAYQLGKYVEVYVSAGSTIFYSEANHFINTGVAVRLPE